MFHSTHVPITRAATALLLGCLVSTMGCQDLPTEAGSADSARAPTAPLLARGGNGGGPGGGGGGLGGGGASTTTALAITSLSGDLGSDGHGNYLDGKCGVKATWEADPSFLSFRPVDNGLNKKDEKDIAADPDCAGVYPRSATIDLAGATVRGYCVNPAGGDGCAPGELVTPAAGTTLDDLAGQGVVDLPAGETISSLGTRVYAAADDGDASTAPGSVNTEYCLDDGTGRPFRFDPGRNPGSNELAVTLAADGRPTRVATQPAPDNVGSCLHTRSSDGAQVVLLVELDFAVDIAEAGGA